MNLIRFKPPRSRDCSGKLAASSRATGKHTFFVKLGKVDQAAEWLEAHIIPLKHLGYQVQHQCYRILAFVFANRGKEGGRSARFLAFILYPRTQEGQSLFT